MIGKLKGTIDSIFEEYLILDVNSVGYQVFCSSKNLSSFEVGMKILLVIQTIVREDSITLFGFLDDMEKSWFETLCKVNGIGSKMALKIMGTLTMDEMLNAIDSEDSKCFCRAPGVGQKIAARIIIELKNIRKNFATSNINISTISTANSKVKEDGRLKDALSALENLGYQRNIAYTAIVNVLKEREDIVVESLITEALKKINNF